jgi:hypothetical protein
MSSSRAKGLKVIDEELEQVEEELFLAFSSVLSTHRQRERERQTDRGPDHERDSNWICS